MVVQLRIEYEQVVDLVEQLTPDQQETLLVHILSMRASQRPLTPEERIRLLNAAKLDNPVAPLQPHLPE
jgi:hypothetical protein